MRRLAPALAVACVSLACGTGALTSNATTLASLSVAEPTVPVGGATTLNPVFAGGAGVIDHGIGAVRSGVPVGTGALSATTTYTLTVTDPVGATASAQATVAVMPAPGVERFAAAQPTVTAGAATTLTAVFVGGTGVVDHGVGPVTSGVPVSTGALSEATTFTLIVTGIAGAPASAQVEVSVAPAPLVTTFEVAPPVVPQGGTTTLTAVFAGGTGVVDHGIGAVTSGVPVGTGALSATTDYTLTVTNPVGATATAQATVAVLPSPTVGSFAAAQPTVTAGGATTLTAVFAGGTGVVDHGVGAVTSGVPVSTGALSAATTYTLTVTNAVGATASAQVAVGVAPAPLVASFEVSPPAVPQGGASTLTAVFAGGTGVVDHGIGAVTSGMPVSTGALSATTTYTLTVTNTAGATATAQATATVSAPPQPPTIASFGAAQSPVASGGATTLTAVFAGGTGAIDHGVGAVTSGVPVPTGVLSATTTYTLTVTNTAGASATAQATVSVAPSSTINSFQAGQSPVASGGSTTLTAVFANGTGVIDHGIGAVTSGVPVSTGALSATTTYTLTVTNPVGAVATAQTTVTVAPAPTVASFGAEQPIVTAGSGTTLTAFFSNGSGAVDHGVGAVASGVPVSTGPLSATTTYALTVTNTAGAVATAQTTVTVAPAAAVTSFGAARPTVTAGGATTLTPVFSGGSGVIDQGIGAVTSGVAVNTGTLSATTTYTLTVTNPVGATATAQSTVTVVAAPSVTSLVAATPTVTAGGATALTAVFAGGIGAIDHGVGALTSGVPVSTGPLSATTTYTLTVTNAAGAVATAQTTVTVAPAPTVTSFGAAQPTVTAGGATTLAAVFSGGTGLVDRGIGAVTSGVPVTTGALAATTGYTLTVTNAAGATATAQSTVTVVPAPAVTSFGAAQPTVTAGGATTLTALFAGGAGVIDHGVGAVTSGVPINTGALAATTLFTLTVTNAAGTAATAQATVTVTPVPVVTSFVPAQPSVPAGGSTTLTAVFSGGTGVIDHGIGAVTSGVPAPTGPLSATTLYTLTVTNAVGATSTAQATVTVPSAQDEIWFTTEGASFAPVIVVEGTPDIVWSFPDGSTSASATPVKIFGSDASRITRLRVTPWSAVKRINLGFDRGDGGSDQIELVANQQVSAVAGLSVLAPTLQQWCASHNPMPSLDFSNFTRLDTIEAYQSYALTSVILKNTPALKRACFEQCGLRALDLSESPKLVDLRGAENGHYTSIDFGTGIYPDLRHICVRDNPQFTTSAMFADMTRFPNLAELWIWNTNQAGELWVRSSRLDSDVSILIQGNRYTTLNLQGALLDPTRRGEVHAESNQLSGVSVAGCVQLTELWLGGNPLSAAEEDAILATLDGLGRARLSPTDTTVLRVDLSGNVAPTAAGRAHAVSLAAKGWTVVTAGWTEAPP